MDANKHLLLKVVFELRANYQEKFSGNDQFEPPAVIPHDANINFYMIRMLLLNHLHLLKFKDGIDDSTVLL